MTTNNKTNGAVRRSKSFRIWATALSLACLSVVFVAGCSSHEAKKAKAKSAAKIVQDDDGTPSRGNPSGPPIAPRFQVRRPDLELPVVKGPNGRPLKLTANRRPEFLPPLPKAPHERTETRVSIAEPTMPPSRGSE